MLNFFFSSKNKEAPNTTDGDHSFEISNQSEFNQGRIDCKANVQPPANAHADYQKGYAFEIDRKTKNSKATDI